MYSPLKIVVDVMAQVACRGHDLLGSFLTPQRGTGAKDWHPGSDFCRLTLLAVSKQTFISGRTRIQVRIRAWLISLRTRHRACSGNEIIYALVDNFHQLLLVKNWHAKKGQKKGCNGKGQKNVCLMEI